jgi:BlaI family penicillinase repressor
MMDSADKRENITDAEWLVMRALWDADGDEDVNTISPLSDAVRRERDVSMQTVKTLLRRLIDKKLVAYEVDARDARVYHYRALIRRDEAVKQKSDEFVSHIYQSNAGEFLAHFVENSGLSQDELLRLRHAIEQKITQKPDGE